MLLVDDGVATGTTARSAVAALKQRHPAGIVIALPVAAASTCEGLSEERPTVSCVWRRDEDQLSKLGLRAGALMRSAIASCEVNGLVLFDVHLGIHEGRRLAITAE